MTVVDLSNNNAVSNLDAALGAVDGLVHKATEGPGFTDGYFASRVARAQQLGKWHGAYDFGHPGRDDPVASANHFCDVMLRTGRPPRVVLDFEVTHTNPRATTDWALTWGRTALSRVGRTGLTLYTYPFFSPSYVPDRALLDLFDLWIAAYPRGYTPINDPSGLKPQAPVAPWGGWVAWQFTSSGRIPGVSGAVDLNTCTPSWANEEDDLTPEQAQMLTDMATRLARVEDMLIPTTVHALSHTYLGRDMDPDGSDYWWGEYRSNPSAQVLHDNFTNSPEGKAHRAAVDKPTPKATKPRATTKKR